MSKKRKKKRDKLPSGGTESAGVTSDFERAGEGLATPLPPWGDKAVEAQATASAPPSEQEVLRSIETKQPVAMSVSEGIRLEAALEENGDRPAAGGPDRVSRAEEESLPVAPKPGDGFLQEQEEVGPESAPGGLFARISRFFQGLRKRFAIWTVSWIGRIVRLIRGLRKPSPVEVAPGENLSPSPNAFPPRETGAQTPPVPEKADWESRPALPEPERPRPPAPSVSIVDHVHAILTLERVLPELEATRQQLQQERESAQARIRQLETERDLSRAAAERARVERGEMEARAGVLRKAVDALERQLQEEQDTAATRIAELEAERDQMRSGQSPPESRLRSLEEELQAARSAASQAAAELEEGRAQRDRLESLLERLRGELETLQRQLQLEKEAAREQGRELEAELARRRGATEQARAERSRLEERAGLVQKALEVLEEQLREERETAAAQIQQLGAEREQARAKCADLEARARSLGEELESAQRRQRKKKGAAEPAVAELQEELQETRTHATQVEFRLQTLENELITAQHQVLQEKQAATTRIQRLEGKWEELKARLLPRDQELSTLRQQTEEFHIQIHQLESALARAQENSKSLEKELSEQRALLASTRSPVISAEARAAAGAAASLSAESGQSGVPLPPSVAEPLYHQTIAPLTVLLASADLVLMNPKLDPGLRETAQEIKTQGQTLLEIIRTFALPPESQKSH